MAMVGHEGEAVEGVGIFFLGRVSKSPVFAHFVGEEGEVGGFIGIGTQVPFFVVATPEFMKGEAFWDDPGSWVARHGKEESRMCAMLRRILEGFET